MYNLKFCSTHACVATAPHFIMDTEVITNDVGLEVVVLIRFSSVESSGLYACWDKCERFGLNNRCTNILVGLVWRDCNFDNWNVSTEPGEKLACSIYCLEVQEMVTTEAKIFIHSQLKNDERKQISLCKTT